MNSQISSDATNFQPTSMGASAQRVRAPANPSLVLGRARRAVKRQAWIFVVVALLIAGGGAVFDLQGSMRPLAAALLWAPIGIGAGLLAATLRELSRDTVTLLSGLGKNRSFRLLGAAPELTQRALRELAPDQRSALGCVIFQPASPFAAAFRDLQTSLRDVKVAAFIAPLSGEGATTAALCTAVSAVQQGRNVIIVDCDTRRRSLTKALGASPEKGVLEACEAPEQWRPLVREEPETGLHYLPAARMPSAWRSLVGTPGLQLLIAHLRDAYDLVVLDCPSALRSGEGPVLASLADTCVAVAAWDQTPLAALRQTVRTLQRRATAKTALYVNRVLPGYRYERKR